MNQSAESASLFLDNRTCYANPCSANSVFRVDWPMVLGNMYNKYDKFKMVINTFYSRPFAAIEAGYNPSNVLKITGLNFINSCSGGSAEGVVSMNNTDPRVIGISGVITGPQNNEATLQVVVIHQAKDTVSSNVFGSDGDSVMFDRPPVSPVDISFIFRDLWKNKTSSTYFTSTSATTGLVFTVSLTIYGLYD